MLVVNAVWYNSRQSQSVPHNTMTAVYNGDILFILAYPGHKATLHLLDISCGQLKA